MRLVLDRRSSRGGICLGLALASLFLVGDPQPASAQGPKETSVSLFVGASEYDLSGVGWTTVFGPRVDHRILGPFSVQLSLPIYGYEPQFGDRLTYVLPELSLLISPRRAQMAPYFGFGAGWSFVISGPNVPDAWTLHAALGIRAQVVSSWDLRSEFRVRTIDPWAGVTADISGGLGYRF